MVPSALAILFVFNLTFEKFVDLDIPQGEKAQIFPKLCSVDGEIFLLLGCFYYNKDREERGRLMIFQNREKVMDVMIDGQLYYGFSIVEDSLVLVGDRDGNVYLYNMKGEVLKRLKLEGPPIYDIHNDSLILFYQKYWFSLFEPITMELKNAVKFNPIPNTDALVYRIFKGKLYVQAGRHGNSIICCNPENGDNLWEVGLGMKNFVILGLLPAPRIVSSMDFVHDTLYAGTMIGDLLVINNKGKILNMVSVSKGLVINSIREMDKDRILIETHEGILSCVEKKTMQRIWEFKTEGETGEPPLVLRDPGLILTVDAKGNIYILDFNGSLVERTKIDDDFDGAGYLLAGDIDGDGMIELVLKGSLKGRIYIADTEIQCKRNEIIRGKRND